MPWSTRWPTTWPRSSDVLSYRRSRPARSSRSFPRLRPSNPSRSRRSSTTIAVSSSQTPRTGSIPASWRCSRQPRRRRASWARCSPPRSVRTRCCGGPRRSAPSWSRWSSTGFARASGRRPISIVATVVTTSSTAVDPVPAIAAVAEREGLWLHVDSAYAGPVALIARRRAPFAGWERADSIVINPHKWLFTPLDASLLLTRRLDALRTAFSLSRAYIEAPDGSVAPRDYTDFTPQLGRRFRALKLWIQLRWFGLEGLRRRIDHHIELAQEFASWIDADPEFERLAPVPFSTVCFRYRPAALRDGTDAGSI